jgi:hypothetical protein
MELVNKVPAYYTIVYHQKNAGFMYKCCDYDMEPEMKFSSHICVNFYRALTVTVWKKIMDFRMTADDQSDHVNKHCSFKFNNWAHPGISYERSLLRAVTNHGAGNNDPLQPTFVIP